MYIKPETLIEGQFFYENDYGVSVLFIVTKPPVYVDEGESGKVGWVWEARAVADGEIVDFFNNPKYPAYAPKITHEPEYFNVEPPIGNDETGTDI